MSTISRSILALSSTVAIALWSQCARSQVVYEVTRLGPLGPYDSAGTTGINDSGQVSGFTTSDENGFNAFLYSSSTGVWQNLSALGNGVNNQGLGINSSGDVVGFSEIGGADGGGATCHAFLYSNGVMQDLGTPPNYLDSDAWAINDSGQITGSVSNGGVFQEGNGPGTDNAFIYSNGVWQLLGGLPGFPNSIGTSINASGEVAGFAYSWDPPNMTAHAFLYSNGVMQDLGTLGGTEKFASYAAAINKSGDVVGYSYLSDNKTIHAFLYQNGVMHDIFAPTGDTQSQAVSINDSGQILGTVSGGSADQVGTALYTNSNGQWQLLYNLVDPSNPLLQLVPDIFGNNISNNGTIAASGYVASGDAIDFDAYLFTPNTVPTVTPKVTGTLRQNGWYVSSPTTLTWKVTGTPTPTTTGCGKVSVPETTGITYTCSAKNPGGTVGDSVIIKRDSIAPKVIITKPANNAIYSRGQNVLASFTCTDAISGVASCVGTVPDGDAINTVTLGTVQTFSVVATDNAGNTTTKTVSYTVERKTALPKFSPAAGTYSGTQNVAITDSTPSAVIYYTTDGTNPTNSSPVYGSAIPISSTQTLKAIALSPDDLLSAVETGLYTIN